MPQPMVPPWGVPDQRDLEDIQALPTPRHWRALPGEASVEASWDTWLGAVVGELADFLWPRHDRRTGDWAGAAAALAPALTDADFELFGSLQPLLRTAVNAAVPTTVEHLEFFEREDAGDWGGGHAIYDPALPRALRLELPVQVDRGLELKHATCDLQMKRLLQRPRAYQVAALRGDWSFSHQLATSATTSSLVSGHCLQAAMAGVHVHSLWKTQTMVGAGSLDLLGQLVCDIGDRRVFAGVHYPSDNLSSWFTAMRLIPRVFEPTDAADAARFLWRAVTTRSAVHAAMVRHASDHRDSPYRVPLDRLAAAAATAMSAPP